MSIGPRAVKRRMTAEQEVAKEFVWKKARDFGYGMDKFPQALAMLREGAMAMGSVVPQRRV
eukprot:12928489-Prorocentrum_lima.AAC.1